MRCHNWLIFFRLKKELTCNRPQKIFLFLPYIYLVGCCICIVAVVGFLLSVRVNLPSKNSESTGLLQPNNKIWLIQWGSQKLRALFKNIHIYVFIFNKSEIKHRKQFALPHARKYWTLIGENKKRYLSQRYLRDIFQHFYLDSLFSLIIIFVYLWYHLPVRAIWR